MSDAELHGQHRVRLGSSFTTTNPQDSDAYVAFRYNFQPSTIDGSRPSTLQGGSADGSGDYILTTPSKESKEARHVFKGTQTGQKDIDCLLIYDESSDSYRLEKLASIVRFDHQRQTTVAPGHAKVEVEETEREQTKPTKPTKSVVDQVDDAPRARKTETAPLTRRKSADMQREAERQIVSTPVENPQVTRPAELARIAPEIRSVDDDEDEAEENEDDDEDDDGELDDLANMLESTLEETNPKPSSQPGGPRLDSAKTIAAMQLADESSEDED